MWFFDDGHAIDEALSVSYTDSDMSNYESRNSVCFLPSNWEMT